MTTGVTYRAAWHSSILTVIVGVLIGIACASKFSPDLHTVGISLLLASPVLVLLVFLIRLTVFVRVTPEGVRTLDTLLRLRTASWSSIYDAKPTTVLGLKYLRVYSQNSRFALWVPLQLTGYNKFLKHLHSVAPEDNPLVVNLVRPAA